jgi:hypothetical protein
MSVYLKPCTGCPLRQGCVQRDEFRRRVAGLGLRSATFNCDRLKNAIVPGTRVAVSHPISVEVGGGYEGPEYRIIREDLPATITGSGRDYFSCVVDRDALATAIAKHGGVDEDKIDTYRFRKTMSARRIVRFLDEPRRPLCGCGNVRLPGGRCDSRGGVECEGAQTSSHSMEAAG